MPSVTGFGSDQIVAARLITAYGELLSVTEIDHPELLWAIRGAGQFFGLVTELTIRAQSLAKLGNDTGAIWNGTFVFPYSRAKEVCDAMSIIMNDEQYATSGLLMLACPPPAQKPTLVISTRLVGQTNPQQAYKLLFDLKPLVAQGTQVAIQNTNDAPAARALEAHGDFKRFSIVGLPRFDINAFLEMTEVYDTMITECPDAKSTSFNFKWDSRPVKQAEFESAMSHHHVRFWTYDFTSSRREEVLTYCRNNLIWHTDASNIVKVSEYNSKAISLMRAGSGQEEADWIDSQNHVRTGPLGQRFGGNERVAKLRELKRLWDPSGVFTRILLD